MPFWLTARESTLDRFRLARHPARKSSDIGNDGSQLGENYWKSSTRTMSLLTASNWVESLEFMTP
jgi:hypothetical protein